jgi:hypothetical protein
LRGEALPDLDLRMAKGARMLFRSEGRSVVRDSPEPGSAGMLPKRRDAEPARDGVRESCLMGGVCLSLAWDPEGVARRGCLAALSARVSSW